VTLGPVRVMGAGVDLKQCVEEVYCTVVLLMTNVQKILN